MQNGYTVGDLHVVDTDVVPVRDVRGVAMVTHIEVAREARRQGIATKMYELAARTACDVFKKPLASDTARSGAAEGFWEKQEQKGRARLVNLKGMDDDEFFDEDEEYPDDPEERDYIYVLTCPPPKSLTGLW